MEQLDSIQLKNDYILKKQIIAYTPGGMHVCNLSEPIHLEYASDGLCKMLGYSREEFEEITQKIYVRHMPEEDWHIFIEFVVGLSQNPDIRTVEYRMIRKDGSIIYVSDTMESMLCEDGMVRGYSSVTDITQLKKVEKQLIEQRELYKNLYQKVKISKERFKMISSFSGIMFYEYDIKKQKYISFENTENVLGYSDDFLRDFLNNTKKPEDIPCGLSLITHPEDMDVIKEAHRRLNKNFEAQAELRFKCFDGSYRWFSIMCHTIIEKEEKPNIQIGCIRNIDSIRREIDMLRHQAIIDPMTGLMNKVSAFTLIDQILVDAGHEKHAFMFIDLDNFKDINDKLGHAEGDKAIKFASNTLKNLFRAQDVLARFGGDEFIAFLTDIESKDAVLERANKFNDAMKNYEPLIGTGINLSASIGVSFSTRHTSAKELLLRADEQVYKVKKNGKGDVSFEDDSNFI